MYVLWYHIISSKIENKSGGNHNGHAGNQD